MQKLGINLNATKGLSYEEYIKSIKALGFTATFSDMSLCDCPEKISELCAKYGLEYQTIHAPFKNCNNMWLDNLEGEEMLQRLLLCVEHSHNAAVPINVVHLSSGNTPPPISPVGEKRFARLIEFAAKQNVKIAFENLRIPSYLKWAMDTFKDNNYVGFCWDIGHENCFTRDIEYMSLYGDRLLCTHIHDNFRELGYDLHLIPFDGKIDFKKVAYHLKNSSYKGPLMLEVFAENEIYNTLNGLEFQEKAYNAIKEIQKLTLD